MGCHFLLQRIFLTQGLNSGLLHHGQILYRLSHQGSPFPSQSTLLETVADCAVLGFLDPPPPPPQRFLLLWCFKYDSFFIISGAGSSGAAFPETGRDSESLTVSRDANYLEAPGHGILPAGSPAQSRDGGCEVRLAGDGLEGTAANLRGEPGREVSWG